MVEFIMHNIILPEGATSGQYVEVEASDGMGKTYVYRITVAENVSPGDAISVNLPILNSENDLENSLRW